MQNNEASADAVPVTADDELARLGVAAAAAAIRNGDITSESYSSALLRRARQYSDLSSFITIDESAVLAAARNADKARAAGATAPASPAPLIEHRSSFTVAGEAVDELFLAKNTVPTSGAGLPGISIPIGLTGGGLPIGLEIDAAHGHDRELLDLARRVESVFDTLPAPA